MKWEVGKTYTWKDENAKTDFVNCGGGCLSPLNDDITKSIGDKPLPSTRSKMAVGLM